MSGDEDFLLIIVTTIQSLNSLSRYYLGKLAIT